MKRWLTIAIFVVLSFLIFSCAPSVPYYKKITKEEAAKRTMALYVADLDYIYKSAFLYAKVMFGKAQIYYTKDKDLIGLTTGLLYNVLGDYTGSLTVTFKRINKKEGTQDTVLVYADPISALRTETMAKETEKFFEYLDEVTAKKGGRINKYGGEVVSGDSLKTP